MQTATAASNRRFLQPSPCICDYTGDMRSNIFIWIASQRQGRTERVWRMCPRKHLRILPTRTRPSLFGSD